MTEPLDVEYVELRASGTQDTVGDVNAALKIIIREIKKAARTIERELSSAARDAGAALAEDVGAGAQVAQSEVDDMADHIVRDMKRVEREAHDAARAVAGVGLAAKLTTTLRGLVSLGAGFTSIALVSVKFTVILAGLAAIVGAVAVAVVGLTSAVAGLVPLVGGLVAALGTASGVLVVLPGVIATLIGVIATLKVGLHGVGDALKAVASGDVNKLNEAIKDLAPSAQQFVRVVASLQDELKALRLDVQNRLFRDVGVTLKLLAETTLPSVREGLDHIADALNTVVIEAINELNVAVNRTRLDEIFVNIAKTVRSLGVVLAPLGRALIAVIGVGTGVLADLTLGLGESISSLADKITVLAETGELRRIFEDGLVAAGQFLHLATDVLGIIHGIFTAAGGGNSGIFSFFTRLNELVNRPDVQASLNRIFVALSQLGRELTPVLVALARALGPVARALVDVAEAFAPTLITLVTALGDALASLAPAFIALAPLVTVLASGLVPLADVLVGLVTGAAPGLAALLNGIVSALQVLAPVAFTVGSALGEVAASIGQALIPVAHIIADLLVAIAPSAVILFAALADGLERLAPVAPIVGQALGALLNALAPLLPALGTALANALTIAAGLLAEVSDVLGPLVGLVFDAWRAFGEQLTPVLLKLISTALPGLAQLAVDITQAFAPLIPVLSEIAQQFTQALLPVLPGLVVIVQGALLPAVKLLAESLGRELLDALRAIMPFLPTLIDAGVQLAVTFARFFVAIAPLLPPLIQLSALFTEVLLHTGALQAGMLILIGGVVLLTLGLRLITIVISAVVTSLKVIGGAVATFASAISGSFTNAVTFIENLPGKIVSAVGNLGHILFDAGKSVVRGLIDGIKDSLGALKDTLGNVGKFITDHKGPRDVDRQLLTPAGHSIIGGLITGIRDALPGLRDELTGLTASVPLLLNATGVGNGVGSGGASTGGGQTITVNVGNVSFGGAPTPQEALKAGEAVGRGIAAALTQRTPPTRLRTI